MKGVRFVHPFMRRLWQGALHQCPLVISSLMRSTRTATCAGMRHAQECARGPMEPWRSTRQRSCACSFGLADDRPNGADCCVSPSVGISPGYSEAWCASGSRACARARIVLAAPCAASPAWRLAWCALARGAAAGVRPQSVSTAASSATSRRLRPPQRVVCRLAAWATDSALSCRLLLASGDDAFDPLFP